MHIQIYIEETEVLKPYTKKSSKCVTKVVEERESSSSHKAPIMV